MGEYSMEPAAQVERALRRQAEVIRATMPEHIYGRLGDQDETFNQVMGWVASQFEHLAHRLAEGEPQRTAQNVASTAEKPAGAVPDDEVPDFLEFDRPAGLQANWNTATVYGGGGSASVSSGGAAGSGMPRYPMGAGGGGSAYQPGKLVISHWRIYAAARAAYEKCAATSAEAEARRYTMPWAHLDQRDKAMWRAAAVAALQAALERPHERQA